MWAQSGAGVAGALGMTCCILIAGIALGVSLGAVILRAACSLYNKMVGGSMSPQAVVEPSFGKAAGIVTVNALVGFLVGFVVGLAFGQPVDPRGAMPVQRLMVSLIMLPVNFFILSGILSAMLPAPFTRAMLVALVNWGICIVIGIIVAVIIVGVSLLMGGLR